MTRRRCSGSCSSPRLVDPVTSQKMTETVFRSSAASGDETSRALPQDQQYRARAGFSSPHSGQADTSGVYAGRGGNQRALANTGQEKRALLLEHLARDHEPLNLIRALVDLRDLGVAHHSLHRVLLHVPVAAED